MPDAAGAPVKILWIDDDSSFLEHTMNLFKNLGHFIKSVTTGKKGIERIRKKYFDFDLIMLDLDLNDMDMDGIDTYKAIRKLNPKIPVIFVSAHTNEGGWERKLKSLGRGINQIPKPFPMAASKNFATIEDLIKSLSLSYREGLTKPLMYSLDEFMNLSDEDVDRVFDDASLVNSYFVKNYFAQFPDIDWVVIAKEPGNIIASGRSKDEPYAEDLERLASEYDAPVFTYSRTKIIEQIDTNESIDTKWSSKHEPNGYYPTVTLRFDSCLEKPILKGDFDTGSTHSFLSLNELLTKGIIKKKPMFQASSDTIWGIPYKYHKWKLKCVLLGNSGGINIDLDCELVKNWLKSPLTTNYPDRLALIGRNLLLENKVKLLLNGEKKETDIVI